MGVLSSTPTGATWTLTNTAGNRFAISGNNLVAGSVATNYEGATSHEVTVRGTRGGETFDKAFTITVNDVDEISDITLSNSSINEDAAQNTVVGALTSTPAGATWAITDTAGNRFALSGSNVVRGATALDYETATSHQITIRGTRGGETFDKTFTITVNDVGEFDFGAPTISSPYTRRYGTAPGEIDFTSAGSITMENVTGDTTYTLISNPTGVFSLSAATINGKAGASIKRDTTSTLTMNQSYPIVIRVANSQASKDVTVTINPDTYSILNGAASITVNSTDTTPPESQNLNNSSWVPTVDRRDYLWTLSGPNAGLFQYETGQPTTVMSQFARVSPKASTVKPLNGVTVTANVQLKDDGGRVTYTDSIDIIFNWT